MNILKRFPFLVASALLAGAVFCPSCDREASEPLEAARPSVSSVSFSVLGDEMEPATRTVLSGSDIEGRKTCITLAAFRGGTLYRAQHFTSSLGQMSFVMDYGDYTVYSLVNMGDMVSSIPSSEDGMRSLVYSIPSYQSGSNSVSSMGIPMAGSGEFTITSQTTGTLVIPVKRLLAKVEATLNCNWPGGKVTGAKVFNMNGKLRPFATGGSAAASSSDVLSFQEVQTGTAGATFTAVFYVPENLQGTVSGITDSSDKRPDGGNSSISGKQGCLTYLEVETSGSGIYDGTVTYRSYLGNNAVSDFNIVRNTRYQWTLNYHENGLQDNNWKVDQNLQDKRSVSLLNPVYVEPSESFAWSSVLDCNFGYGNLYYSFSGGNTSNVIGSALSGTPSENGSVTIKSTASAGQTSGLVVRPSVNPTASTTRSSEIRVVNKSVAWIGYDSSVYASENRKVYQVSLPSGSAVATVEAPVDFYYTWGGVTYHERNRTDRWSYTAASGSGISGVFSAGSGNVSDKVVYSVTSSAQPGDYEMRVSRVSPWSGSDVAYLRVVPDIAYYLVISPVSGTLNKGNSGTYKVYRQATRNGVDYGDRELLQNSLLDWSTGNLGIASIDSSGKVTAVGVGTTTITAVLKSTAPDYSYYTAGGRSVQATITVVSEGIVVGDDWYSPGGGEIQM